MKTPLDIFADCLAILIGWAVVVLVAVAYTIIYLPIVLIVNLTTKKRTTDP